MPVTPDSRRLVHLCDPEQWRTAQRLGEHRPDSLTTEGFIHLSAPAQVHLPANRLFAGRRDLLLLHIDPGALTDPVRWESGVPTDPAAMRFPHLYGPLPVAAVTAVSDYLPGPDGTFAPLPD